MIPVFTYEERLVGPASLIALPECQTSTKSPLRRMNRAWAAHLSAFAWSHVVHLTTKKSVTPLRLIRMFQDRFIRRIAFRARQRVPYFYAVETQVTGHPHLHALIAGSSSLKTRELERLWNAGFTRIAEYDPSRAASFYVSKSLVSSCGDDYGVSSRLPERFAVSVKIDVA